jgi:prepilin-type processing-associated H-X9-DG protein
MRINGTMTDGPAYKMGMPTPDSPPVSFAMIADGLSNTVIFSEWVKGTALTNTAVMPRGNNLCWNVLGSEPTVNNAQPYSTATFALAAQNCQNTTRIQDDLKGQQWMNQQTGRGGSYSHTNTPNKKACVYNDDGGGIQTNDDHTAISASSNHPGGVNVLFLDGSVKFVKESVNQMTWWAIATRAGGEVVSADAF